VKRPVGCALATGPETDEDLVALVKAVYRLVLRPPPARLANADEVAGREELEENGIVDGWIVSDVVSSDAVRVVRAPTL
jgi:hypothetical protein